MQQSGSMNNAMSEQEFEEQRVKYRELLEELQDKADSSGVQGVDPDVLRNLLLQGNQLFVNGENISIHALNDFDVLLPDYVLLARYI